MLRNGPACAADDERQADFGMPSAKLLLTSCLIDVGWSCLACLFNCWKVLPHLAITRSHSKCRDQAKWAKNKYSISQRMIDIDLAYSCCI